MVIKKRTLLGILVLSLLTYYLSYVSDPASQVDRDPGAKGRAAAAKAQGTAAEIMLDIVTGVPPPPPPAPPPTIGEQRDINVRPAGAKMAAHAEADALAQKWGNESGCDAWGCSCQGVSDTFGTYPHHWGTAVAIATDTRETRESAERRGLSNAQSFWMDNGCKSYPAIVTPAGTTTAAADHTTEPFSAATSSTLLLTSTLFWAGSQRVSQPHATPHAPCDTLYCVPALIRVLIGACNLMLCPVNRGPTHAP